MTTLYLAEYYNGELYEDAYTCVVGVYSTVELAEAAGAKFMEGESGNGYDKTASVSVSVLLIKIDEDIDQ